MAKRFIDNFSPDSTYPMKNQITEYVRQEVTRGHLSPGDRIPPLRDLAELWETSYFTVNDAFKELVREGVLVRRPRLGTFVQERKQFFDNVAVYFQGDTLDPGVGSFYVLLESILNKKLRHEGAQVSFFMDTRPDKDTEKIPSKLASLINDGKIDAFIGGRIGPYSSRFIDKLQIPAVCLSESLKKDTVVVDSTKNWDAIFDRFKMLGCKSLGLVSNMPNLPIANGNQSYSQAFFSLAKEKGFEVKDCWNGTPEAYPLYGEDIAQIGYDCFHKIWRSNDKPDGVYIYPDVVMTGAVGAILELGIDVPHSLKVIAQRNKEIDLFCPFPVDWLSLSIENMADSLINKLKRLSGNTDCFMDDIVRPELIKNRTVAASTTKQRKKSN